VFGPEIVEPKGGVVSWSSELETGMEVLDQQHRKYIDLLNVYLQEATEQLATDNKSNNLKESFGFLLGYAAEHFLTEEEIMKEKDFPGYAAHRKEHQHFMKHVGQLSRELKTQGFSEKLSREVNFYAIEWFIDHILGSDMELVEYLKAREL